jgi:hypothetical protein
MLGVANSGSVHSHNFEENLHRGGDNMHPIAIYAGSSCIESYMNYDI